NRHAAWLEAPAGRLVRVLSSVLNPHARIGSRGILAGFARMWADPLPDPHPLPLLPVRTAPATPDQRTPPLLSTQIFTSAVIMGYESHSCGRGPTPPATLPDPRPGACRPSSTDRPRPPHPAFPGTGQGSRPGCLALLPQPPPPPAPAHAATARPGAPAG